MSDTQWNLICRFMQMVLRYISLGLGGPIRDDIVNLLADIDSTQFHKLA